MLNLIKVNVLTFFDLHKLINAKTNKEFFYAIARLLFLLLLLSFFSISIYKIIEPNIKEYKEAEILFIILGQYMAIISSVLIASNIQKIDDLLFKFKDYNLLFSLPIKKHKIFSMIMGGILLFVLTILVTNLIINAVTKADVQIPDLVGMEQTEAQKTVEDAKLKYEKKSEEYRA